MKKIISLAFLQFILFSFPINGDAQNISEDAINSSTNGISLLPKYSMRAKPDFLVNKETSNGNFDKAKEISFWLSELDSIGVIHNNALDYAYQRMRNMNLSNLSASTIPDLVANLTSEFFTNRYGSIYNFSQEDLKNEILSIGLTPMPPTSQNVSQDLLGTVNSISNSLNNLSERESARDFENMVTAITNISVPSLGVNEQMYLRGYANVITKSMDYWDNNAYSWVDLFNNASTVEDTKKSEVIQTFKNSLEGNFEGNSFIVGNIVNSDIYSYGHGNNGLINDNRQRHPCATAIASADGGGLFSGFVRGCIVGALFGAGVGCIPAAIFWGGVQGVSASIGAGITCLAMQ